MNLPDLRAPRTLRTPRALRAVRFTRLAGLAAPLGLAGLARLAAPLGLAALAAPAFVSCGGDDDDAASPAAIGVLLTPGQERDAWDRAPTPARVVVTARVVPPGTTEEQVLTVADQPWPFDQVSTSGFGANWSALLSVEVFDAAGATVMRGETPFFSTNEAFGSEVPVLVGRQGEFARTAAGVVGDWPAPKAALFGGRYV
ncbi:MAG TPA: hypothetical protein VFS00_19800, partial [Polyangiaceae bacterium]|nr:hypothetical protein [Polyangiaceae bacterium]